MPLIMLMALAAAFQDAPAPETLFADARAVCERDAGALWGRDLCGPMMVVDRQSRAVVANRAGPSLSEADGVWRGTLPTDIIVANTATDWGGTRWTMLLAPVPETEAGRRNLVTHENFHRIQGDLGIPMASPVPAHLATAEGRTLMRMEWRALAAALSAANEGAARIALADALAFRAARRTAAGEAGAEDERGLELNEGLAEYTAVKLTAEAPDRAAVEALGRAESGESFSRAFAYASGPAYGLLLDRFADGWRRTLTSSDDLGALLGEAAGASATDDVDAAGERYGLAEVAAAERETARAKAEADARWTALLVEGPVLRLPFVSMKIGFNPNGVSPLPPHGTVYPTLTVTDAWGVLTATEGALIDGNWQAATVPAPTTPDATSGPGWSLNLAKGWRLVPGERAGDYVIERAE